MRKVMKLFVVFAAVALTVVFGVNNASAQTTPAHSGDAVARTQAGNNTDAILSLAGKMDQLKAQIAEVEKKCQSATGSTKWRIEKQLDELKKQLEELKKSVDCTVYTGEVQAKCLELTSEGTSQRLIEAYEKTLTGQPASVQTNADGSTTTTFPVAQAGMWMLALETITITRTQRVFQAVKRVRYQPLPRSFQCGEATMVGFTPSSNGSCQWPLARCGTQSLAWRTRMARQWQLPFGSAGRRHAWRRGRTRGFPNLEIADESVKKMRHCSFL